MKQKSEKLFKNTFLFLIGNIGSKFMQFFLVPLYACTLNSKEFGISELIITTISLLIPIISLQVSDGVLRYGLDKKNDLNKVLNSTFKILFFESAISLMLIPLLNLVDSLKCWTILLVLLLNLRIYRDIFSIILKVQDKNKMFAIDSILYTMVLCLTSFMFLYIFKLKVLGYLLSYIFSTISSIFVILFTLKLKVKNILCAKDSRLTKDILMYSAPLVINAVSYWITSASDKYMIEWLIGSAALGIYAVATKIPTIMSTLTGVFNNAWLISAINEYDSKEKRFYDLVYNKYVTFLFVLCSFLILTIKIFMKYYVSKMYFISWMYVPILLIATIFSSLCGFLGSIFYSYKQNVLVTYTTVEGAVINIILNLVLIPKFGIFGASISTFISWFYIFIVRIVKLSNINGIKLSLKKIFFYSFMICIQMLILYFVRNNIQYLLQFFVFCTFIVLERENIISIYKMITNKMRKRSL